MNIPNNDNVFRIHEAAAAAAGLDPLDVRINIDVTTGMFCIDTYPNANIPYVSLKEVRIWFDFFIGKVDALEIITGSRQSIHKVNKIGLLNITRERFEQFAKDNSISDTEYTLQSFVSDYVRRNYDDVYLKKSDITALLLKCSIHDKYFNPVETETDPVTPLSTMPETALQSNIGDIKKKNAKKQPWINPFASCKRNTYLDKQNNFYAGLQGKKKVIARLHYEVGTLSNKNISDRAGCTQSYVSQVLKKITPDLDTKLKTIESKT